MTYDELKSRIDEYLRLPNVKDDKEVISLYTLCNLLENRFSILRNPYYNEEFIKLINKDNKATNKILTHIKQSVFPKSLHKCYSIRFESNLNKSEIIFDYDTYGLYTGGFITIGKNKNSDDLYYKGCTHNIDDCVLKKCFDKLIEKYQDRLIEIFEILEYFSSLINGDINKLVNLKPQIFTDDFLNIQIGYRYNWEVYNSIIISEIADPEKNQVKEYNKKEPLVSYLLDNSKKILSVLPIEIDELNDVSKQIIEEDYLHTREKPQVLSLRR